MSSRALGDGKVIDIGVDIDPRDQEIERLRAENRRLQRAVSDSELLAQRAREDADRALSNLRRQLSPLYRALQMVFGELDAAGVSESRDAPASAPDPSPVDASNGTRRAYQPWIDRFGRDSAQGRVTVALLEHGGLTVDQIRVAAQMAYSTAYEAVKRLRKLGLIEQSGGKYSLKQL